MTHLFHMKTINITIAFLIIFFWMGVRLDTFSFSGNAIRDIAAQEVDRLDHFVAYDDGTVIDETNRLMWAARDNSSLIDWHKAAAFCKNFRAGGYSDWRLPTVQELETLFAPDYQNTSPPTEGCSGGYYMNRLFRITCCCLWAAEDNGVRPAAFPFNLKEKLWHHQTALTGKRVLPVRNLEQMCCVSVKGGDRL